MSMRIHWGAAVAVVYGLFAAGTVGVVIFAATHQTDLVSWDYYAQALAEDAHIAAVENGRHVAVRIDIDEHHADRALVFEWPIEVIKGATGSVTLYRPADAARDRTFALAPGSDGRQRVPLDGMPPGRWVVQLRWTSQRQVYYVERPVSIP